MRGAKDQLAKLPDLMNSHRDGIEAVVKILTEAGFKVLAARLEALKIAHNILAGPAAVFNALAALGIHLDAFNHKGAMYVHPRLLLKENQNRLREVLLHETGAVYGLKHTVNLFLEKILSGTLTPKEREEILTAINGRTPVPGKPMTVSGARSFFHQFGDNYRRAFDKVTELLDKVASGGDEREAALNDLVRWQGNFDSAYARITRENKQKAQVKEGINRPVEIILGHLDRPRMYIAENDKRGKAMVVFFIALFVRKPQWTSNILDKVTSTIVQNDTIHPRLGVTVGYITGKLLMAIARELIYGENELALDVLIDDLTKLSEGEGREPFLKLKVSLLSAIQDMKTEYTKALD